MLNLKTSSEITQELLIHNKNQQKLPKKVTFNFPESYLVVVTNIKTTEISAECILYGSMISVNETNHLSDLDYWSDDFDSIKIKDYWCIGSNGQGDLWLLNKHDTILFFDHNDAEITHRNLTDLGLNFEKWLQFAFLNKDFVKIIDKATLLDDTNAIKVDYRQKMQEISTRLEAQYPFEI